ncbi:FMN-binding negative transcriptional regulator [Parasedimentitalea huanghaiensis]|uniref:FMN-binding negative transcriptional regulator n=1 Tax=Parasedimentitalea huanghaiensis TaxID=2682100 RepID=A0A6L6WF66_9RHOB|nr:FMN-binding negative transcriptional regulator [Zongyanglinia huanghaiensis]MVO16496.1 FMN-binding negative transcriptional regulator [Zongyanglinia huanghaiensis]
MHPNPMFHDAETEQNLDFARARGYGVLAISCEGAPLISHVPFLLSQDGQWAELHLVRSNPIVKMLKNAYPARIAVSGPDGYVSPDWYGVEDQVPTWNYVAVHLTGDLELRPADELRDLLDRQSAFYEAQLLPKPPWSTTKMAPETLERMMRMIVPARMRIRDVDGTWKLSQNKSIGAREAVAEQIKDGLGSELETLAVLMQGRITQS